MSEISNGRSKCVVVTFSDNRKSISFVSSSSITLCARIDTEEKPIIALLNPNSRREVQTKSRSVRIGPFVLIPGQDYEFNEDDPGFAEAIDPIIESPKPRILTALAHFSGIGTISLAINNGYNHELNVDTNVDGLRSNHVIPPNKITIFHLIGTTLQCLGNKIFHGKTHLIKVKEQNFKPKTKYNHGENQTLEEMIDILDEDLRTRGYVLMYYLEEAVTSFHSTNIKARSQLATSK